MLACDVLCIVYKTNLHNEAFIFWNLNLLSRNINVSFFDIKLPNRFYANYHTWRNVTLPYFRKWRHSLMLNFCSSNIIHRITEWLSLLYATMLNSPNCLKLFWCAPIPQSITLLALCWTLSSSSIGLLYWGAQTRCCRCGFTSAD